MSRLALCALDWACAKFSAGAMNSVLPANPSPKRGIRRFRVTRSFRDLIVGLLMKLKEAIFGHGKFTRTGDTEVMSAKVEAEFV